MILAQNPRSDPEFMIDPPYFEADLAGRGGSISWDYPDCIPPDIPQESIPVVMMSMLITRQSSSTTLYSVPIWERFIPESRGLAEIRRRFDFASIYFGINHCSEA